MEEKKISEELNNITIIFDSKNSFVLASNNPDLDGLVSKIVSIKDECDFSKLTVTTKNKEFDIEGFEGILKKSISTFLNDIIINKENLQKAIDSIQDKNDMKGESENEK